MDAPRQLVCSVALTWLGTPFRLNSWTKGEGASCVGLILGIGRDAGVLGFDPDSDRIRPLFLGGPMPLPVTLFRGLDRFGVRIDMASRAGRPSNPGALGQDIQPGDILLLRRGNLAQHLGVLLPGERLINSEGPQPPRGVIAPRLPSDWRRDLAGAWRYRGLVTSAAAPSPRPSPTGGEGEEVAAPTPAAIGGVARADAPATVERATAEAGRVGVAAPGRGQ